MKKKIDQNEIDMLHGTIWNKLLKYALPVAATGILEQLFNASDVAVVGKFSVANGTTAVAAVGANSPIIGLILNFFIGISLGANVVIANAVGRGDKETVHQAVHTAIMMALVGGLFVTLLGEMLAGTILNALQVPEDVFPYALLYLRIYLLGVPVILLYNFEAAIFRSLGETKVPLQVLTFSGILNVLLNLFFVIVLKMTVNGVAIATVLSNLVSAIILFGKLVKSDNMVHVEIHDLRIHKSSLIRILKIGFPAGTQSAVFAIANIVIQSAINSLGTTVMAASSAALNLELFAYYVLNSFSQACTTFVGQNYGAGKLDRCKKILRLCLLEDAIASVTAILLVLISGKFLLSFFSNDPEVIEIAYTRLLIVFTAYISSMLYEVMSGYLRGFGISLVPAIITMVGVCLVRIVWIHTVFPVHRTFQTILLAYPLSLTVTAILIFIVLILYRPSHRYKGKKI